MPDFPAITHVALTVTSLERSVPWYEDLFGAEPLIHEDTGPFHHVVWLLGGDAGRSSPIPGLEERRAVRRTAPGSRPSRFRVLPTVPSWSLGKHV